jgi:hypothetical protein
MKQIGIKSLLVCTALAFVGNAVANTGVNCTNKPFSIFSDEGFKEFANEDGAVDPGAGGQNFDAEYLFYKYDKTSHNLSIGLQTGFNLKTGRVDYNYKDYYAGDLALSFNGAGYQYAVDFGLNTRDYYGRDVSADTTYNGWWDDARDDAGLYEVTKWNNNILYNAQSSPFAMDDGSKIQGLTRNDWGTDSTYKCGGGSSDCASYYRIVTFNVEGLVNDVDNFKVDTHWTMSCGNDNINGTVDIASNGSTPVPEPSILALFSLGSLGLFASGYRRRKLQN